MIEQIFKTLKNSKYKNVEAQLIQFNKDSTLVDEFLSADFSEIELELQDEERISLEDYLTLYKGSMVPVKLFFPNYDGEVNLSIELDFENASIEDNKIVFSESSSVYGDGVCHLSFVEVTYRQIKIEEYDGFDYNVAL